MAINANIILFAVIIIVAIASLQTHKASSQIKCIITTPTNTEITKWININSPIVKFKINGKNLIYINDPKCIKTAVRSDGLFMFFPTKINIEYFAWSSKWPLNPLTLEPSVDSPENEYNLQLTQELQDLGKSYQGMSPQSGKQGLFAQWMPIITIIGFVIVGFFIYQVNSNTTNVGNAVNVLQSMMQNYMASK